jgi:hypothetical protein
MLVILVVFAALAIFGQWERARRAEYEKATIVPAPALSPSKSPSPEESGY